MRFLYSIGIYLYSFGILLSSLFNAKAREWVRGRRNLFERLAVSLEDSSETVWFHCASLGEYEQAKPLIEIVKAEKPACKIITTFFSPSGYVHAAKDGLSDMVSYLPIDTPRNARKFVEMVRPRAVFFVKYEYWYNFMNVLHEKGVPFYYISAIFREKQYFFRSYGRWFAKHLAYAGHFFVQDENSRSLLGAIGINEVTVCGDTRFDRVKKIADDAMPIDFVESFRGDSKLIVAGSTWRPDEELLSSLLASLPAFKLVVAPHEVSRAEEVKSVFSAFKTATYSHIDNSTLSSCQVLIVDTVGMLSRLYRYGDISYVGGAFKTGLHNTLEPAVYGKPVFFGPRYERFNEAVGLVKAKGAFSVRTSEEMLRIVQQFLQDHEYYKHTCQVCEGYVAGNLGAARKIFDHVKNQIK